MASIDKRVDGRYRTRWREYPGGPAEDASLRPQGRRRAVPRRHPGRPRPGVYIDPNDGKTLFQTYAEQWRAGQLHRPSTASQAETYLRVHAYPSLGQRPRGAIRRSEIPAWVKNRSEALAPGSVELVYRWVATIFKAAVSDRLIAASPCQRIALPKRSRHEIVPLDVGAVERHVATMPDGCKALIVFAAGTGLRQGECFGLTVDRIDFLRRQCVSTDSSWARSTVYQLSAHRKRSWFSHRPAAGDGCRCARRAPRPFQAGPARAGVHEPVREPVAPQLVRVTDIGPSWCGDYCFSP